MHLQRSSPAALAAVAGGLGGFVAAVLLHVFADQPIEYGYVLADRIGGWAGIPANHWIRVATFRQWGWEENERTPFLLLSLTLNGALWAAAAVAVTRALKARPRFRRTVATCAMITVPLAGAQWLVKLPGPMGGGGALQASVYLAHVPGIALLQRVGLCCGYDSSVVIRDWGDHEGYRPSALAVFLLVASNLVMYVVLAYAGPTLWRRVTRGRDRRRAAAPVAPG